MVRWGKAAAWLIGLTVLASVLYLAVIAPAIGCPVTVCIRVPFTPPGGGGGPCIYNCGPAPGPRIGPVDISLLVRLSFPTGPPQNVTSSGTLFGILPADIAWRNQTVSSVSYTAKATNRGVASSLLAASTLIIIANLSGTYKPLATYPFDSLALPANTSVTLVSKSISAWAIQNVTANARFGLTFAMQLVAGFASPTVWGPELSMAPVGSGGGGPGPGPCIMTIAGLRVYCFSVMSLQGVNFNARVG